MSRSDTFSGMTVEKKRGRGRPPKPGGIKPRTRKMFRMAPEIVEALKKAKRRTKLSETAYVELALKAQFTRDDITVREPPE
jgi:hypothetical protein